LEQQPWILGKKRAFDRFFQELVSKPTGFWNKLNSEPFPKFQFWGRLYYKQF
jgi:hypothetical protein